MPADFPLPSYAASIWTADGRIWLGLPPSSEGHRGTSVHFPQSVDGLAAALAILRARETADRSAPRTLGLPGVPTQVLADAIRQTARTGDISTAAARALAVLDRRGRDRGRKPARKQLTEEDLGI